MKRMSMFAILALAASLGGLAWPVAAEEPAKAAPAATSVAATESAKPQPVELKFKLGKAEPWWNIEGWFRGKVSPKNTFFVNMTVAGGCVPWKGATFDPSAALDISWAFYSSGARKGYGGNREITSEMLDEALKNLPAEVLGSPERLKALRESTADIHISFSYYTYMTPDEGKFWVCVVAPTREAVEERVTELLKVLNYYARQDRPGRFASAIETAQAVVAKNPADRKEQEKLLADAKATLAALGETRSLGAEMAGYEVGGVNTDEIMMKQRSLKVEVEGAKARITAAEKMAKELGAAATPVQKDALDAIRTAGQIDLASLTAQIERWDMLIKAHKQGVYSEERLKNWPGQLLAQEKWLKRLEAQQPLPFKPLQIQSQYGSVTNEVTVQPIDWSAN
jgi:hypothetical protein